jgi:ABC-type amino acid transport system permease subunit
VSYRTFKRRLSEIASHDLLEWFAFALGLAFFALAIACVWGVVVAISSLGDPDTEFKTSAGFLQATRGVGIVLFGLFALVAAGVGWFLAGDTIRRLTRRAPRS